MWPLELRKYLPRSTGASAELSLRPSYRLCDSKRPRDVICLCNPVLRITRDPKHKTKLRRQAPCSQLSSHLKRQGNALQFGLHEIALSKHPPSSKGIQPKLQTKRKSLAHFALDSATMQSRKQNKVVSDAEKEEISERACSCVHLLENSEDKSVEDVALAVALCSKTIVLAKNFAQVGDSDTAGGR